jgi:hypothetical protein
MEEKITKAVEDIRASIRWTLGICAGAVVALIIWTATLRADQIVTEELLMKVNQDYMPFQVTRDIFENNDKMIEIFQIISNSGMNAESPLYKEAIKARDKFQRDALMNYSNKRGGSSGGGIGGNQ